jgi:hypothetical protein
MAWLSPHRVARNSHALELDEQRLVRIRAPVDPLEPVAEANHDTPILKQIAQGRYWRVGRIAGKRFTASDATRCFVPIAPRVGPRYASPCPGLGAER